MNEEVWEPKSKTKIFYENEHLIWKVGKKENDIITPEGYEDIKTEKITSPKKMYIRKFFVNNTPVKATLYENKTTKETGYFFEGTPFVKLKDKKNQTHTK